MDLQKVYIVFKMYDNNLMDFDTIFSTKEKAREYIKAMGEEADLYYDEVEVDEYD